ncbi:MAG TPA: outer membrane beta-barrel protein [Saprospiraceae bacterium]|nr:outer membrane beta-barrel protein [Saprospiraceae bacterium]
MIILVFGCVSGSLTPASSQVRLGIKAGLSTSDVPSSSLIILDERDAERFRLAVEDAKYGLHFGMFIQAQMGHFFIQPEILFNTVTMDYSVEDLQVISPRQIKDEIYRNLDLPLILGFKFGPVRIGGGPIGHLFLDSTSDLLDFADYSQDFDRFTYGWQAGVGLDIWKLHLDARYENNFNNYGDHIVFFGREYKFSENPSRIIVSAGISF